MYSRVSKWTVVDDDRLVRFMSYIAHEHEHELVGTPGPEDVLAPQRVIWPDADWNGEAITTRSTSGLYAELRKTGALLTEFAPPVRPAAHRFPQRNRIVAGLADAVLVVQAGLKSGARITASHAADIGVDVLACPGPVDQPASEGCHALLKDGAGMVTCVEDVLQALAWDVPGPMPNTRPGISTGKQTGPDRARLLFPYPVLESRFDILVLTR